MISSLYLATFVTLVILSFPIMNLVDQEDYNLSYLVQLGITATILLLILFHLNRKISRLSTLSQDDFVMETRRLQLPVLFFAGSFYLRLVMTAL